MHKTIGFEDSRESGKAKSPLLAGLACQIASVGQQLRLVGGRGEIRTHGGLAPTTVFKTVALNRSATLPSQLQRARIIANYFDRIKVTTEFSLQQHLN